MGSTKLIYGDRLDKGSAGSRQVVANLTSKAAEPPLEVDRWARNGKAPNAQYLNALHCATNAAVLYRSKQVFNASANFWDAESSGGAGDRRRWGFACHTGPYSHAFLVKVVLRPQDVLFSNNTYVRLDLSTNADESSPSISQTFVHGVSPLGTTEARGWQYLKETTVLIDGVTADTDWYGTFYDVDGARIQAACVLDLQSMTEGTNGYLAANITAQSSVLDVYREKMAGIQRNVWRRGAAHILSWNIYTSTTTSRSTSSATDTNIVDNSSTSVAATSPGWTFDMRGKDRLMSGGVPCVMKAFGNMGSATTGGTVKLKDSGGNTVASIANAWTNATPQWKSSGVFMMPATVAKYDITYATPGGSGTFTLRDISIYEYET